ncbi:MAG: ABC transporter permease subunit [Planctomycetes bacterium]|nr:ABC transporter permease subunit [Planctomycetota bacterium]MCW8136880.1 ABC transporter permease subunit [Planctomycetota bacterium]
MASEPVIRDRYATKRPWRHFAALVAIAVLVLGAFWAAEWDFSALTDSAKRERAIERAWSLVVSFSDPELSSEWLETCWHLTLETLAAACMATFIAVILAYVLAMGASRAVCVGEAGGRNLLSRLLRLPLHGLCAACRLVLDVLRAVPDFAWAVILVAALGLGPVTGAVALSLNITGILGKVYSELWDSVEPRQYEQVRALGAGRLNTFLYGIRPLASRSVQSFTLMRAECAIRNAAVIGAVGGGGLGAEIMYQIGMGGWGKVTTLIIFTLALTLTADLSSNFIRRQLRTDPNHPRAVRARSTGSELARGYIGVGFALMVVVWSVWYMGYGNSSGPDGQTRNYLEPLAKLASGENLKKLAFFEDLLSPDFDGAAIGMGDAAEVQKVRDAGKDVRLFEQYGPLDFWRPAAWEAWELELRKWFVWRVVKSSSVPLAMAIVGTLLGVLGAMALTYPHSMAFMLESSQFTGEAPHPIARVVRLLQMVVARGLGLVARGVPEVMWAFLFIAFFGPGLLAGTVAIALHSMGVLVRVFSETVDNIPYRRFEQSFLGSRMTCFAYTAGPMSWRDWMTYSFFQFESNVRTGVVLGIVGVGGLGFFFTFNFEWFRFEKASTHLLMIILLTVVIDRISRLLKLSRVSR